MLADVEQIMLTVRRPLLVQQHIATRFGVSLRTARRYVSEVYKKWRDHEKQFDTAPALRESRRNNARATFELVVALAINRTEVVKNEDGKVLLDEREFLGDPALKQRNPAFKLPVTRPKPDLMRVIHALNAWRHLDGLDEPLKAQLNIVGLGESLPDLDAMPEEARRHLVAGLEAMAPGGDLRKLAGDLFTSSARAAKLN
jgi:hypothetical protein